MLKCRLFSLIPIVVLVFINLNGNSQCFDEESDQIDELLTLPYKAANLSFFEATLKEEDADKKACLSYHHGKLCYSNGDKELAKNIWKKGFYDLKKTNTKDSLLLHRLIYNCGIIQLNTNQYTKAIHNFKLASNFVVDPANLSKCNIKIGTCYKALGEFTVSNYYYQLAAKNNLSIENLTSKWLSSAYGQIAVNYSEIEEPDSALKYAKLQIESAKSLPENDYKYKKMYSYIVQGDAYETKREYYKYIDYSKKALLLAQELNNVSNQFKSLSNIGYAYNKLNDKTNALKFLNKAKGIALETDNNNRLADATNTIADVYYNSNDFKKSTELYLESLTHLLDSKSNFTYKNLPSIKSIEQIDYLSDVFNYAKYISISMVAKSKANDDKQIMKSALNYIHFADSLLFMVNENTLDNTSKFHWRKQANELYSLGIEASDYIKDNTSLFYFIERGKYFVLRDLMADNLRLSQLSPTIQNKLQNLREQISALEIKNSLEAINQQDLTTLINLKETYHTLKDTLSNNQSGKIEDLKSIPLSEIKSKYLTSKDELYISYLESSDKTYAFFICKDSSWLKTIEHSSTYLKSNRTFIESISQPLNTNQDLEEFLNLGHFLYQKLLPKNISQYKNIIINPSGTLNYIPFDALCSNIEKKELLIHNSIVRYTLSPSIELQNKEASINKQSTTLFIAPIEFKQLGINSLANSKNEVESIKKVSGGKLLMNEHANKATFKANLEKYKGIHFATHSMASNEAKNLPWIAFYDEKMYLPEIYNLPLKDKFVVLSACETFRGNIIQGEGIMNLVWGIHHAGSKSVVATLWNTYDKANEEIMKNFYSALKKGDKKEVALRKAKLNYINTHGLKVNQWAPFIYIGESSSITYKSNHKKIRYFLLGIGILMILSISFYKIKSKA